MAEPVTPQTFIPHDTALSAPGAPSRSRGGLNDLLLLMAIVLFVTSVSLAVGVFLYQQFLATEAASKVAQLQRAKQAFEPSLVQQLTRLDDRMHAASRILGTHLAPTRFFQALEQATLQSVAFSTLDLEAADAQHITIKMQGLAQSVNAIALQADLFSKNGVVTSPIFSNISRQVDGVHFNLSALVNPAAVNFAAAAAGAAAGNPLPAQTTQGQGGGQQGQQGQQEGASPFGGAGAAGASQPGAPSPQGGTQ